MWETMDGCHRLWTRAGTQSAKPIFDDIEGEEWETLHDKYVEVGKEVNLRQPSTSRKAKTLWKINESKSEWRRVSALDEAFVEAAGGERAESSTAGASTA